MICRCGKNVVLRNVIMIWIYKLLISEANQCKNMAQSYMCIIMSPGPCSLVLWTQECVVYANGSLRFKPVWQHEWKLSPPKFSVSHWQGPRMVQMLLGVALTFLS